MSILSSSTRLVAGSEEKGRKYTWHILWQVLMRGGQPNSLPAMGNPDLSHEGRDINLMYLEFSKMLHTESQLRQDMNYRSLALCTEI